MCQLFLKLQPPPFPPEIGAQIYSPTQRFNFAFFIKKNRKCRDLGLECNWEGGEISLVSLLLCICLMKCWRVPNKRFLLLLLLLLQCKCTKWITYYNSLRSARGNTVEECNNSISRSVAYHAHDRLRPDDCITIFFYPFLLLVFLLFCARVHSSLLLRFQSGEDRLDVVARDFRVTDSRGDLLFAANRKVYTNFPSTHFLYFSFQFNNFKMKKQKRKWRSVLISSAFPVNFFSRDFVCGDI